jgi:hypothetical protein
MIRTRNGRLKTLAGTALLLSLIISTEIAAQELNLFEGVQNGELPEQVEPRRNREDRGINEPVFTLVGTSRIGNTWKATLRTRSGDTVAVRGASEDRTPIPGHNGYFISNVEGRRIAIAYPAGAACTEFNERGVSCVSGNFGSLNLTTGAPIAVTETASRNGNGDRRNNEDVPEEGTAEEPSNPFAAALRAAAGQAPEDAANRRAEAQRFQMRRIDPSEVPPGQRLVRTPFGDRLISE